jgi:hypothetical protein
MFSKFFTLSLSVFTALIFSSLVFGQATLFEDNFDSYTAGVPLVTQNPTDWELWSGGSGTSEDPMVSTTFAASAPNAINVIAGNDLVHQHGTHYTTGMWKMSFDIYVPTGLTAYFNTLHEFAPVTQWAMQVYFNQGGLGNMDAGGALAAPFTYPHDTWMHVEVIANLDADTGEMWLDGVMLHTWQWSLGTFGTGILQLAANNFFGGGTDGVPDYHFDNYKFEDMLGSPPGFSDDFESYTAGVQLCTQTTEWETWSGTPGTGEDPFVTTAYSYSGSNSVVEIPGNDFVRRLGNQTSGKWYMSFLFYIPAGASGYFNTMTGFTPDPFQWAMDCFFDVGGTGRIDTTGSAGAFVVDFTWTEGQWNQATLVVDLDTHVADFWIGTSAPLTFVAAWDYTQGGTKDNRLAVNDFFGGAGTDEMYIDNYWFGDTPPVTIPVELTSFTANVSNEGNVILNWTTATELNNQMFEIERREAEGEYFAIGFVNGHGTTTEIQEYSYVDNTVGTGTYFYRLKQIDFLGQYEYSDVIEVEVKGPLTYGLEQNYPNPFNPSTKIKYSIAETGLVRLSVYNLIGEEVSVLVNGQVESGFYEVSFDASDLPSGAYFYRLQAGNTVQIKKMLLMK